MGKSKFLRPDITFSQDLSLDALSYTTAAGQAFKLDQILFKASVNITETITITLDSAKGADYDTVLASVDLTAEQSFVYKPDFEANYQAGDKIKVQCTNANTTGVLKGIIKQSEV
jgi:hypothetical protein